MNHIQKAIMMLEEILEGTDMEFILNMEKAVGSPEFAQYLAECQVDASSENAQLQRQNVINMVVSK